MKFRKKVAPVDAFQWQGDRDTADRFRGLSSTLYRVEQHDRTLILHTSDGVLRVEPTQWVMCDAHGVLSTCTDAYLAEHYEPVTSC